MDWIYDNDAAFAGHLGSVVRNHLGDGRIQTYVSFNLDCGRCGHAAWSELWHSDFTNSFPGENGSCSYAPINPVDGDPQTGWSEGAEGVGIGVKVIVPALLDMNKPVRIRAGYGKSPELFAANGRPKRIRVTVLRLRAEEPDAHDASECSYSAYVEPVAVAAHEISLRDFNSYQALTLPEFQVEHYLEYPRAWLKMDGAERWMHQQKVNAGQADVFVEGHLSVDRADLKAGLLAVVSRPQFHPTSSGDTGRCSAAETRAASMTTMACRTLSAVTASAARPASASAMFS